MPMHAQTNAMKGAKSLKISHHQILCSKIFFVKLHHDGGFSYKGRAKHISPSLNLLSNCITMVVFSVKSLEELRRFVAGAGIVP